MAKFCDKCGEKTDPGMQFCNSCGNKLISDNEETKKTELKIVENVDEVLKKEKKRPTIVMSYGAEPTTTQKIETKPIIETKQPKVEKAVSYTPVKTVDTSTTESDTPLKADGSIDYGEIGRKAAEEAAANLDYDQISVNANKTAYKKNIRTTIIGAVLTIIFIGAGVIALETDAMIYL